jgi:predicted TIM-barrel fold metal-dependent hydrolase
VTVCEHVTCRAPLAPGAEACARCGFPLDRHKLRDPEFLASAAPRFQVSALLDMHQIVPATDGALELQLEMMRRLRIERALLQSAPPEATSLLGNDRLGQIGEAHPRQFWISQYLDPRDPAAAQQVRQLAAQGGRVVKLLPPTGWEPDEPGLRPFWAAMNEYRMVAMAHTGSITARHVHEERAAGRFLNSRHARPVFFDEPARRFPNVTFLLCHMGSAAWCEEAAQLLAQHDNVWGDISGFGLLALRRLMRDRDEVEWGKILWGNDAPAFAYPFNLRLLAETLEPAGHDLVPRLLHDNAREFACRHLT